jgi:hypothetical protein
MSVKLNATGFEHAKRLIQAGEILRDDRGMLSSHKPSTREESEFLQERGMEEYSKWYLAIDDSKGVNTRTRYKFPLGDFERVHRCSVLVAESSAGQYADTDLVRAAGELRAMIDAAAETEEERRAA